MTLSYLVTYDEGPCQTL